MPALGRGEFAPLQSWLREHVHVLGCLHLVGELIEPATGAPLETEVFEAHLRAGYLAD